MRIDVLTLFPEMFAGVLGGSILKRAADPARPGGPVASYHVHNLRDWSPDDKHRRVDSPPYGGGPGMVIQCPVVGDAAAAVGAMAPGTPRRILVTPQGRPLTQPLCEELAGEKRLLILAGHYEGIDQRVIDQLRDDEAGGGLDEVSVGDYVLSGGELPAMTIIDAVVRLLPGALGHAGSADADSFSPGVGRLLDHPHYTRPPEWAGRAVPDVLLSGDHARIDVWRRERSREATARRRPDLLALPEGDARLIVLRDAGPADRPTLLDLHRRCFPTDAEARLVADLLDAQDAPFSIAAETDGRLVGHALLSTMTHEHGGSVRGLLALAPLAVAPDSRGRGIGKALVREALRQAAEHRAAAVFVLGDPAYYGPLGFTPAQPAGYLSPYDHAGDAFQVHPVPNRPAPPPGRVDYAPAFARLTSHHSTG